MEKAIQDLVNSGMAWKLEGSIGRRAIDLIRLGYCSLGERGYRDTYGNYIPARTEVQEGTKGSIEFHRKKMSELEGE